MHIRIFSVKSEARLSLPSFAHMKSEGGERRAHTDRDQTCPIRGMASRLSRWWCRHHTFICRDYAIYEDTYCYIYGLILLYMCPHTAIYVSSCCYMCHHSAICVLLLLYMCPHAAVAREHSVRRSLKKKTIALATTGTELAIVGAAVC